MTSSTKNNSKWIRGIKAASQYATDNGWTVIFRVSEESFTDFSKKTIIINSRHPIRVKYYVLLHEIGHAIDMSSILYISPVELHGPKYNTLVYRVEKVKEELSAWDRGYGIAIMNGWPMDQYFYVVRARFVSTYMIWANNRKHPHAKYSDRNKSTTRTKDSNLRIDRDLGRLGVVQEISSDKNIRQGNECDSTIGYSDEKSVGDKEC